MARRRLVSAVKNGQLPQVILIAGPEGVGKQRLGLWIAQLVLCEALGDEPCGQCRTCRLVLDLAHADLHWIVPIPRPKAGEPDKQVEEAAESIAEVLEERRKTPLYSPADGMSAHGMATARLIARRAGLTPVEGKKKVFIIGEADRLVAQESSPEAANALLKLFEEPPADTYFVLTTADPGKLLPTIRSRTVPLRLGRLSDADVKDFLSAHLEPAPAGAGLKQLVARANGSIGAALSESGAGAKSRRAAATWLEAVLAGAGPAAERALAQAPWSARGDFTDLLDAVAETLGDAAREAAGVESVAPVPAALAGREPTGLLQAQSLVAEARLAAQGNVNPQLLLGVLGSDLADVL
ncbi:MAG: DNA polymerase III subunit [Gemmatimonadales bacterium]